MLKYDHRGMSTRHTFLIGISTLFREFIFKEAVSEEIKDIILQRFSQICFDLIALLAVYQLLL